MDDIYYLSRLVLVKKLQILAFTVNYSKTLAYFNSFFLAAQNQWQIYFSFCHYTRPHDDSAESVCVPQTTAAVTEPRQFISPAAGGAKIQFRRKLCILNFH